jgi:hypothetical protein
MRKIQLFFSLFVTLAVGGCNAGSSTSGNGPVPSKTIVGTWDWVHSEGGFRGGFVTPAEVGYHQQYTLRADSTFSFVRTPDSAIVSWNGRYGTTKQFYQITQDTQSFIMFTSRPLTLPPVPLIRLQYHGTDTILLGEDATDGIIETYARTK